MFPVDSSVPGHSPMETEGEAGASGKVGVSEVGEGVDRPAGGKGHPGLCLQRGARPCRAQTSCRTGRHCSRHCRT